MSVKENPLVMLIEESIRLRDSAQQVLSEVLATETLTRLERLVLLSITEFGRPLTVSQVGRNLGHSRQVVQRAANQLVSLGFLEKLPNPDHKTSPLLQPTDSGRAFERQMGEALVQMVNTLLTDADIATCLRVADALKKLRTKIENFEGPDSGLQPSR